MGKSLGIYSTWEERQNVVDLGFRNKEGGVGSLFYL